MKKLINKIILIITFSILLNILLQPKVFAAGAQASGTTGTLYNKTVSYFFELIRQMETITGTLGVSSNIDTTTGLDSTGNGIDCHLEKNTEYGTITLLAASEYGNAT